jgi:RNA-directed DNA polymerase
MQMTISSVDENPKQEIETNQNSSEDKIRNAIHDEKVRIELLRLRWRWVEASIWTDSMLTALENGVKGRKWFSLYDKVYAEKTLQTAWLKVRRNKGAAGVDKISISRFERHAGKYLEEIRKELIEGTYKPLDVKRVHIPKEPGKTRPLGIPAVIDRIAQAAVKLLLEPIFENIFLPMSYGFRPERGAKDALREVDLTIKEGYTWVVDADLQSYFDTIPHDKLKTKIECHVSDGKVLKLISQWLEQGIMEDGKRWIPTQGTPQGGVLSPVLANLYLHDLDVKITKANFKMVRYADDFVILTRSREEAESALQLVREWVKENGLILHPDKTHIGDCMQEGQGFDFLGYRFEGGTKWIRRKSIQKFRDAIRQKTSRLRNGSIGDIIADVNKTLKGWYQYFKHVTKWGLQTFDSFVRRRLRAVLLKRVKKGGLGRSLKIHMKWPNKFFAKHGIFTMEQHRCQEIAGRSRRG